MAAESPLRRAQAGLVTEQAKVAGIPPLTYEQQLEIAKTGTEGLDKLREAQASSIMSLIDPTTKHMNAQSILTLAQASSTKIMADITQSKNPEEIRYITAQIGRLADAGLRDRAEANQIIKEADARVAGLEADVALKDKQGATLEPYKTMAVRRLNEIAAGQVKSVEELELLKAQAAQAWASSRYQDANAKSTLDLVGATITRMNAESSSYATPDQVQRRMESVAKISSAKTSAELNEINTRADLLAEQTRELELLRDAKIDSLRAESEYKRSQAIGVVSDREKLDWEKSKFKVLRDAAKAETEIELQQTAIGALSELGDNKTNLGYTPVIDFYHKHIDSNSTTFVVWDTTLEDEWIAYTLPKNKQGVQLTMGIVRQIAAQTNTPLSKALDDIAKSMGKY